MVHFTKAFRTGDIIPKFNLIVLSVGNNQLPLKKGENLGTQLQRMIPEIRKFKPLAEIVVLGMIPRGDNEQYLAPMFMVINEQLSKACKFMARRKGMEIRFVPIHKLFLERFKFKDPSSGNAMQKLRLIRPLTTYFRQDLNFLNQAGLNLLREFLLDSLQITHNTCTWAGAKTVSSTDEGSGSKQKDPSKAESPEKDSSSEESDEESSSSSEEVSGSEDSSSGESGAGLESDQASKIDSEKLEQESPGQSLQHFMNTEDMKIEISQRPSVKTMINSWEAKVAESTHKAQGWKPGQVGSAMQLMDDDQDIVEIEVECDEIE